MPKTPHLIQYAIVVIILCGISAQNRQSKSKSLIQNGQLTCTDTVKANLLETTLKNDIIINRAEFSSVSLGSISTNRANIKSLITSKIIAKNDQNTLYINSLLKVKGKVIYDQDAQSISNTNSDSSAKISEEVNATNPTSFVQLSGITVNNISQWKQIRTNIPLGDINSKLNAFLISNMIHKEKTLRLETEKTITIFNDKDIELDVNHIKIEMTFYFNSFLWNGHKAYIKINNDLYWLDNHKWKPIAFSLDQCEKDNNYWQTQIKMIVPTKFIKGNTASMLFGVIMLESNDSINSLLTQCQVIFSKLQDRNIMYYDNIAISVK